MNTNFFLMFAMSYVRWRNVGRETFGAARAPIHMERRTKRRRKKKLENDRKFPSCSSLI